MKTSILIATSNIVREKDLQTKLTEDGFTVEVVTNGKDCQIRTSKSNFGLLFIDLAIEDYSVGQVLKFLKLSHSDIKVIVLAKNKEELAQSSLFLKPLHKIGVSEITFSPFTFEKIKPRIVALLGLANLQDTPLSTTIEKKRLRDSEVSSISFQEFYSEEKSNFDYYIKLGTNNYKKIINRGELFPPERLNKYKEEGVTFFFILTSDRSAYINYVNTRIKESVSKTRTESSSSLIMPLKNITIKYIEEVHTFGLKPQLVDEAKMICQNMYDLLSHDNKIQDLLNDIRQDQPTAMTHAFLVSFYSIYLCKQLNWAGRKTVDIIALGALLHDIGLMKLPANMRDVKESALTPSQFELFRQHPKFGVDLLQQSTMASEALLQIVYQHHEHLDGSGFPNKISGSKIYPLAKIVSLADCFAEAMIENNTTPKDTLKILLKDRENLVKFDPILMRELVYGISPKT